MPKTGKAISVIILIVGCFLFFNKKKISPPQHFSRTTVSQFNSKPLASTEAVKPPEKSKRTTPVDSLVKKATATKKPDISKKWQTAYRDPLGNPIPYQWLIKNKFGPSATLENSPEAQKYLSGLFANTLTMRLIDLQHGGGLIFFPNLPNTFAQIILDRKSGSFLFQSTHPLQNFSSPEFDKKMPFCIIKFTFIPNVRPTSENGEISTRVGKTSPLLKAYPGYKGIRVYADENRIRRRHDQLSLIDCLIPASPNNDYLNIRLIDLAYAIGAPVMYINYSH